MKNMLFILFFLNQISFGAEGKKSPSFVDEINLFRDSEDLRHIELIEDRIERIEKESSTEEKPGKNLLMKVIDNKSPECLEYLLESRRCSAFKVSGNGKNTFQYLASVEIDDSLKETFEAILAKHYIPSPR